MFLKTFATGIAAALFVLVGGCNLNCKSVETEVTLELRADELAMSCEDVCYETIDDGRTLLRCSRSTGTDPNEAATVSCTWTVESCSSGGL